jgi:hypothetical protein
MKKNLIFIVFLGILFGCQEKNTATRWSVEKAQAWSAAHGWLAGCDYIPATAINQLEMWQADTYDQATIDKELAWAQDLGFNTLRVYLHSLVWQADPEGFKQRIDNFLSLTAQHNIQPMFVFFDDCWKPEAATGKQPEPKPGIHNSGWVQDPVVSMRADTLALYQFLEPYVKDILTTFKNDSRILMWDLYNEPGNEGHLTESLPLLRKVFQWAREVNPSQPVSAGIWLLDFHELNKFQLQNSDIITYHCYDNFDRHVDRINLLKLYDRPLICTEYMARRFDSTFEKIMPMLKEQNVGAINWGFVSGKTNTIFAWSDPRPDGSEPELWFHDIFRPDGTPYSESEVNTIRSLTAQ